MRTQKVARCSRPNSMFMTWLRKRSCASLSADNTNSAGRPHGPLAVLPVSCPSLSPDGRWLVFATISLDTGSDIFATPLDLSDPEHPKAGTPQPLIRTAANELTPATSPDGKWIAYASNEGGEWNKLYVQRFTPGGAGAGGKWEISTGSGMFPVWSRSAQRLFYFVPPERRALTRTAICT